MYLRRPCIIFTGLSKQENEDLRKLKKDVVGTLSKTSISKDEIIKNIDKLHRIRKTNKNKTQNTIKKIKTHNFILNRKQLNKKILKSNLDLLNQGSNIANTLITDNPTSDLNSLMQEICKKCPRSGKIY